MGVLSYVPTAEDAEDRRKNPEEVEDWTGKASSPLRPAAAADAVVPH